MNTATERNPYRPPVAENAVLRPRATIRATTWIGLAIGSVVLFLSAFLGGRIPYLYVRYPGLVDPPSRPVDYWPGLEVELSSYVLIVLVPFGSAVFICSVLSYRRQRSTLHTHPERG
ncbi:MAG: hypothetical protein WBD31_06175 [Rubripirellula sp.]